MTQLAAHANEDVGQGKQSFMVGVQIYTSSMEINIMCLRKLGVDLLQKSSYTSLGYISKGCSSLP